MIRILYLLFLLFSIVISSCAKSDDEITVTVTQGKKNSNRLKGVKKCDSTEIRYYENGQIYYLSKFDCNISKERVTVYYENGRIHASGYIIDDGKDSVWIEFHGNGDTASISLYKRNKLINLNSWDKSGEQCVINGTGTYTTYYQDGKINTIVPMINCKEQGSCFGYYPNGQIEGEFIFNNGTLVQINKWDEDGKLIFTEKY